MDRTLTERHVVTEIKTTANAQIIVVQSAFPGQYSILTTNC